MSEDWSADVRKYAPDADQRVIDAIVKHCGVALQRRDSALVSFEEPTELATVRESFLKKKLGLTLPDSELDAGIARVGERMRGDPTRNRVTVYYLLAEHFRKLPVFGGREVHVAAAPTAMHAGAAGVAASAVASMPERPAERPTAAAEPRVNAFSDRPAAAAAAPRSSGLMRWLPWLVLGALALLALWWLATQRAPRQVATAPAPAPVVTPARPAAAPAAVAPATPAAPVAPAAAPAVAGFPARVFFATDSAAIGPEGTQAINQAAAAAKDGRHRVAVTGFTDRTGDQAHNEELAKNRAVAVRDALTAAGVPAANIEMRPPMMVEIGAAGRDADARRVEISAR